MSLEAAVSAIEGCDTVDELNAELQRLVERAGFESYCFLDSGSAYAAQPYYTGTTQQAWTQTYADNNFINADACISRARRTNRPFTWSEVPLPERTGRHKPGAHKIMEAASDFGYREGFVIPFHFVDDRGAAHSSVCTLFWKEKPKDFSRVIAAHARKFHLLLLYYMQRSIELRDETRKTASENVTHLHEWAMLKQNRALSDRERDVMAWAARGKTAGETADILGIAVDTVHTHIRNSVQKLDAGNKTHAVAKAVRFGLIDL